MFRVFLNEKFKQSFDVVFGVQIFNVFRTIMKSFVRKLVNVHFYYGNGFDRNWGRFITELSTHVFRRFSLTKYYNRSKVLHRNLERFVYIQAPVLHFSYRGTEMVQFLTSYYVHQ